MKYDENYCILAVQSALVSAVTPQLRAVIANINVNNSMFYISFYHDGEIDEKTQDLWECAATEASAQFEPDIEMTRTIQRVDFPEPFPINGKLVYFRHEKIRRINALLIMNQTLLGKIPPNLRAIKLNWEMSEIYLLFYYYNEATLEDIELAKLISAEFILRFPQYKVQFEAICLNYPHPIPSKGELVYLRNEFQGPHDN